MKSKDCSLFSEVKMMKMMSWEVFLIIMAVKIHHHPKNTIVV